MDQVQLERERLLQEREQWQIKTNQLHQHELNKLHKTVEAEREDLIREREVWQEEADKMHSLELEKIQQERDMLLSDRDEIECNNMSFKVQQQSSVDVKDLKFLSELEELLRDKDIK